MLAKGKHQQQSSGVVSWLDKIGSSLVPGGSSEGLSASSHSSSNYPSASGSGSSSSRSSSSSFSSAIQEGFKTCRLHQAANEHDTRHRRKSTFEHYNYAASISKLANNNNNNNQFSELKSCIVEYLQKAGAGGGGKSARKSNSCSYKRTSGGSHASRFSSISGNSLAARLSYASGNQQATSSSSSSSPATPATGSKSSRGTGQFGIGFASCALGSTRNSQATAVGNFFKQDLARWLKKSFSSGS